MVADVPLLLQPSVAEDPPPSPSPSFGEQDLSFIVASPGKEDSLPGSVDLFASRQPRTQDLVPEVILREPDSSLQAASSSNVSIV